MMKHIIFSILLISITSISIAQISSGNSWSEVKKNGTGNINIVYYETPGIIEKGSNGVFKGICADIIIDFKIYLKQAHNKDVTFNYIKRTDVWKSFLKDVKASEKGVLGVGNATITEERKSIYDFTPSFINNPMMLLTHKNVASMKSLDEIKTTLNGYTAKIVEGSTHINYINTVKKEYYPELNIILGQSGLSIVHDIVGDDKIFTIVDFTEFFYAIKQKLPIKRHSLSISNTKEKLGMIMPKGSDWAPLWHDFLTQEYKNSLRYREIITKNLGSQFAYLID
jgi:ABC-type amino acid transport substrate-binding protein